MANRIGVPEPAGGWHKDSQEIVGGDAFEVRALTAGEFFKIEKDCGTDGNKVSQAVVDRVVSIDGKEGCLERLLTLPLADYAHVVKVALEESGVTKATNEEPDDPKPSAT